MEVGNIHVLLVTTIAGILTTVITTFVSIYRENRNRRWDQEDRERSKEELAAKVVEQHKAIARKTDEQTKVLVEKIADNTKMNEGALNAANSVNAKLLTIASMFDKVDIQSHIRGMTEPTLEQIKDVGEDTNARVRGIENANDKT